MKIVIAGGKGFIGSALVRFFRARGDELVLLSRKPSEGEVFWDPETGQLDAHQLEGADVVINLAGESILGRWNKEKMERIRESRFQATRLLCDTLLKLSNLPKLYINASAIGYYGDRGEEVLTEESQSGHGFLAEVCRHWESIPEVLAEKGVRVVCARFGLVLGEEGGALKLMEKPFKMGMGGSLGKGDQIMSWVALDDVVEAIAFIIANEQIAGAVNVVAPGAVSNLEFTKTLAGVLGKPAPMPIPKFAIGMIFGSGAEVFLASTHVHPEKLLKSGFVFRYPELEQVLRNYLHIKS